MYQEEKSEATVEKYVREIRMLSDFVEGAKLSKKKVLEYREHLVKRYQPKTVNTKLSALNSYLQFFRS